MALLTDGRFSGATRGFMAGHVAPEAARGGPIAAVRDGDMIDFDMEKRELRLEIPAEELAARLASWRPPKPRYADRRPGEVREAGLVGGEGAVTG